VQKHARLKRAQQQSQQTDLLTLDEAPEPKEPAPEIGNERLLRLACYAVILIGTTGGLLSFVVTLNALIN
jgi:hypothetical protein